MVSVGLFSLTYSIVTRWGDRRNAAANAVDHHNEEVQRNIIALNIKIGGVQDKSTLASIGIELDGIIGEGRHYSKQLDLLIDSFAAKEIEFCTAEARGNLEVLRATSAALRPPGSDGASLVATHQAQANAQAFIASLEQGMNYLDALRRDLKEGAYRRARGIDAGKVEALLAGMPNG